MYGLRMLKVAHNGFNCYCDGFRAHGSVLRFLSLFGDHNAVRAVWASLLKKHASIALAATDGYSDHYRLDDGAYTSLRQPLGHQILHLVLLHERVSPASDGFEDHFCVIGRDVKTLGWLRLRRRCAVPMRDTWRDEVWRLGTSASLITPLAGIGVDGVAVDCDAKRWTEVLGAAIRDGGLR